MTVSSSRRFRYGLAAITGLALAVRCYRLGSRGLWQDEISVYLESLSGLRLSLDGPLVHLLHYLAMSLFRSNALAVLHAPGVVLSALATPFVAMTARFVGGGRAALLAALLYALSPLAIHYGQEVRPYATLLFCVAGLFYFFFAAYFDGGRRRWLGYAAFAGLGCATHMMTLTLLAGLGVFVLTDTLVGRRAWRPLAAFAATSAAGALAAVWVFGRTVAEVLHTAGPLALTDYLRTIVASFGPVHVYYPLFAPTLEAWSIAAAALAIFGLFAVGVGVALRGPERERRAALAFAAPAAALVVTVFVYLGEKGGWTWLRYVLPLVIPYTIFVAKGWFYLGQRAARPWWWGVLAAALLGSYGAGLVTAAKRYPETAGVTYPIWTEDIASLAPTLDGVMILPRNLKTLADLDLRALNLYQYFTRVDLPVYAIDSGKLYATQILAGPAPELRYTVIGARVPVPPGKYAVFGLGTFRDCDRLTASFPGFSGTSARQGPLTSRQVAVCEFRVKGP